MKFLFIMIDRFLYSVRNNKVTYFVMMLAMTITFVALTQQYCVHKEHIREQELASEDEFTIIAYLDDKMTKEQLAELYNDKSFHFDNIRLSSFIGQNAQYDLSESFISEISQSESNYYFGERISSDNIQKEENVVVVPSVYIIAKNLNIGDLVTIKAENYRIIGENTDADMQNIFYEIPYTTMLRNCNMDKMTIIMDKQATRKEYIDVKKYLSGKLGINEESIELPSVDSKDSSRMMMIQLFLFVSLLALLNCSFLYMYLLEKRKKEYSISRILGCTKIRGTLYLIIEMVLIHSLSFSLGTGIYILLNKGVFPLLLNVEAVNILTGDIMELYGMTLGMLICGVFVIVHRFNKNSLRMQIMEGEDF